MSEDLKRIEAVLDQQVRPALRAHGGEIQNDHLEDGDHVIIMACESGITDLNEVIRR